MSDTEDLILFGGTLQSLSECLDHKTCNYDQDTKWLFRFVKNIMFLRGVYDQEYEIKKFLDEFKAVKFVKYKDYKEAQNWLNSPLLDCLLEYSEHTFAFIYLKIMKIDKYKHLEPFFFYYENSDMTDEELFEICESVNTLFYDSYFYEEQERILNSYIRENSFEFRKFYKENIKVEIWFDFDMYKNRFECKMKKI